MGNSLHDVVGATHIGIWQVAKVQLFNVGGTKKPGSTKKLCCCCTGAADTKADD